MLACAVPLLRGLVLLPALAGLPVRPAAAFFPLAFEVPVAPCVLLFP